jgi:hypothetical protein
LFAPEGVDPHSATLIEFHVIERTAQFLEIHARRKS